ncbi:MAG: toxin-antitoxin system YwqK family antitoxin [Saprospiraceae bacterium]
MITKEHLVVFGSIILSILIFSACQSNDSGELKKLESTSDLIVNDSLLVLAQNEGLVYYQNKPFSGNAVNYFPNTEQIASSRTYQNGRTDGLYQKWFGDGTMSFESHYKNGKQNGLTRSWWKDGVPRSESNFTDGIAHGKQIQWYKSGGKFKEQNLVNGREQGIQKAWRENGKIYTNYEARNGRIFGLKRASLCYELEEEDIKTDK